MGLDWVSSPRRRYISPLGLVTSAGFEDVSQVTRNDFPTVHVESDVGQVIVGTQTSRRITAERGAHNAQERSVRSTKHEVRRARGEVLTDMINREEFVS